MTINFFRHVSRAIFDSDLVATRLTLAVAELCWSIMLFWPGDTFERPTYSVMGVLAPEIAWACAFLFSGVFQAYIALYRKCNTTAAHAFGVWNAGLWLVTVAAMLASVYPPPAAIGGEFALMLSAVWIGVRPVILSRLQRKCAAHVKECHA